MEITRIDGGMFVMDGQTYDLGTLLMVIGFERAENIENQITEQAKQMQMRNKVLEGLSKILAECNSADEGIDIRDIKLTDPETGKEINGKEFMEKYGPWPIPGDAGNDGDWAKSTKETAIQYIKSKMDSLNSESQLDMIRLQGLMSKRDNIYQSISNLMKTDQKSKDNAVANLR
ncbi:hypothetical protein [Desulfothermus sp.]